MMTDIPWDGEVGRYIVEDPPRERHAKDFLVVFVERYRGRISVDELVRMVVIIVVDWVPLADRMDHRRMRTPACTADSLQVRVHVWWRPIQQESIKITDVDPEFHRWPRREVMRIVLFSEEVLQLSSLPFVRGPEVFFGDEDSCP
jgi:hypothetical protein